MAPACEELDRIGLRNNTFHDRAGGKAISRNLVSQGLGQFGGRLLGYVFFLYAARMLGASQFGIFSFALSTAYLAGTIMDFGLDPLCVKWVARKEMDRFFLLASTRIVMVLTGLSVITAVSFLFEENLRSPLLLLGVGVCFFSCLNFIYSYFRGIEKMVWEALLLAGQRCLLLGLGLLLFGIWKSANAASLAFSLSLFATFVVAFPLLQEFVRKPIKAYFSFNKRQIVGVLEEAYPLAVVGTLWVVYYRIDTIMLAGFRDMSEVGLYSGAYKIMEGLILVAGVIMMVTFPRLSRLGREQRGAFFALFKKLFLILFALALGVIAVAYFGVLTIFDLILGEQYAQSMGIFRILLIAVIAIYPGNLVTQALFALDLQKVYMYVALTGTVLNVSLNFCFIPRYGATGAAWATVFTETAVTAACGLYVYGHCRGAESA